MTYKKIVKSLVEQEVYNEVQKLVDTDSDYIFINVETPSFKNEGNMLIWECFVNISHKTFVIGGTVDPICGICVSCMRDENHKYVWFWVEETRRKFGITDFKI